MGSNSVLVEAHLPCPDCGSSDAMSIYSDGHTYCFSCQKTTHGNDTCEIDSKGLLTTTTAEALPKRGINKDTCQKYQYFKSTYKGKPVQVANYYDQYGALVGQKLRFKDKSFCQLGKIGKTFFGQQLFNGGRRVLVTEGEIDCLTLSQMFANREAVVSIPSGAGSARKVFEHNLDWLDSFNEVVVIFDNDKAGRDAVQSIEGVLPSEKLKIVTLTEFKDPNEYFCNNRGVELMDAIDNAKPYTPDNIINGAELWDELENEPETAEGYSLPWEIDANDMLKGIRKGEIILLTAGTGIGKSTLARELMYDLAMRHNLKVGVMMLEENVTRTAKGILSIHVNRPLHINRKTISNEAYRTAFDETLGTRRFVLYRHFGSMKIDTIVSTLRYMAVSAQCDFLVLDHISIAVSGIETKDERKMIDVLMTKLRSLCEETGVGMIAICHLKRVDREKAHEEGGVISLDHLRGSQSLAQLSDTIMALERNQQAEGTKKNQLKVRILKCRCTGDTGIGGYLQYNKSTGRLEVPTGLDEDEIDNEPKEF